MTERESQYPFEKIWIDVRKIPICRADLQSGNCKSHKGERCNIRKINRISFEFAAAVDELDIGIGFAELNGWREHDVGKEIPQADRQGSFVLFALHVKRRIAVNVRREFFPAEPLDLFGKLRASRIVPEHMVCTTARVEIENEKPLFFPVLIAERERYVAERRMHVAAYFRAVFEHDVIDLRA